MQFDNTQEWKEYQLGINYNNTINLYSTNDLNWNMYNGKQWIGVVSNGLPRWTFNICKSAINYFVAFICSQKVKMQYSAENIPDEPVNPEDIGVKDFVTLLSDMADMKWEKDKMDSKLRQLMIEGAVTGDFAAYVYWDPKIKTGQAEQGDFTTELVDGVNVMFGNPNNKDVEAQPYILILGREMVSKLKEEAKANGIPQFYIDSITADTDTQYQSGTNGKIELDNQGDYGKCNYIIKFYKKNDTVYWNKSTKFCPIRKNIDLGISRYPVAWGNWDAIKNSYHGMSAIDGIIDNQISINQLFAMVSYWMKMQSFGKVVYDKTKISSWSNKIGEAIGAEGDVQNIVKQLEAGNFNAAVLTVIDTAIKYTKDFIGANDTLMGQVNPEQASGTAIISGGKQASIPLGNPSGARDQFVEDLGLIWAEYFIKKYKSRNVAVKENDKTVIKPYSTDNAQNILLRCKVDVGPSTYWSEMQGLQSLDNLLKTGQINKLQYFERVAKMNIIPDVQGLIKDAQEEIAKAQQQQVQQQNMQTQQNQMQEQQQQDQVQKAMRFMETLPDAVQQKIAEMGSEEGLKFTIKLMQMNQNEMAKLITEFMKGGVANGM